MFPTKTDFEGGFDIFWSERLCRSGWCKKEGDGNKITGSSRPDLRNEDHCRHLQFFLGRLAQKSLEKVVLAILIHQPVLNMPDVLFFTLCDKFPCTSCAIAEFD